MYFYLDFVGLLTMMKTNNSPRKSYIKINDINTFSDLGSASYMVLDKTGTLTDGEFKIDFIKFGN